ncbi:hypothetical protein HMI54_015488 [Coelomomyces lativittatus]|nr:hypothetical protein HMI56_000930 [Coelomomyces lativittatus]KAJ1512820.1 hypothetical protein HMI54_015488 [Coelomomyces lativittatus]KAJ1513202.1 hypothetical protein HMI55_005807 [Coelomomyces lativittatus]
MPCCVPRKKQGDQSPNVKIDQELRLEGIKEKLHFKLLLLGSGESGKSTFLKQVKLIHKISLTPQELEEITTNLKKNALQSIQILLTQATQFNFTFTSEDDMKHMALVQSLDLEDVAEMNENTAHAIVQLWNNPIIQQTQARKSEFWNLEAVDYYMDNVERFVQQDFEPNEEDMVMARVMTTGILQTQIPLPPFKLTLVDVGGQRTERRKWIHCFDNVSGIIFLCNLAGYNTVLFEDPTENRMVDALTLFHQVIKNPVFSNTPCYLVFNKKDLFEKKIRSDPISKCPCFKSFTDSCEDVLPVLKYVEQVFKADLDPKEQQRVVVYYIAARFKRDVKHCWDEIIAHLKARNSSDINSALKTLGQENANS